jgi:hypothetical protein
MAHLKNLKSLLQSCLAILEQCAHFALTEKFLDPATILLSFNKCVDFVESPDNSSPYQVKFFPSGQATYSVNFPMWINTLGGNSAPVSELMWTIRIAFSNS